MTKEKSNNGSLLEMINLILKESMTVLPPINYQIIRPLTLSKLYGNIKVGKL